MIDTGFLKRLADAKDALVDASAGDGPNRPRTFAFELWGKCSTFSGLMADEDGMSVTQLPLYMFGFVVCCNATCAAGIRPGVLRLVERRTSRYVEFNVR